MLYGIDVSKWQASYTISREKNNADFVMIKATEGETYRDPMTLSHAKEAVAEGRLIGFYHYARPDLHKDPEKEATNFSNRVSELFLNNASFHNIMLALDFEEWTLSANENDIWARKWLDIVHEKLGHRPLLYVNASRAKQFTRVPEGDYGLWLARWPHVTPNHNAITEIRNNTYKWPVCAMWQYRGAPLDLDIFYGDRETWKKYAPYNIKSSNDNDCGGADDENTGDAYCGCPVCDALKKAGMKVINE